MATTTQQMASAAQAAAQAATAALNSMAAAADSVGSRMSNMANDVGISAGKMAAVLTASSVAVLAFVRAGLQGTVEGARLGFQMQLLGREIASIFLPAIDKAINLMSSLVASFQELSGEQQKNIFHWGGIISGAVLLVSKLNPVIGVISLVTAGFSALQENAPGVLTLLGQAVQSVTEYVGKLYEQWRPVVTIIGEMLVSAVSSLSEQFVNLMATAAELGQQISGFLVDAFMALLPVFETILTVVTKVFGFILDAIGKMIKGLGWVLDKVKSLLGIGSGGGGQPDTTVSVKPVEEGKKKDATGHRSVTLQAGGLEGLSSTYSRIQEGVLKTFDPQRAHDEMLKVQKDQLAAQKHNNQLLQNINVGAQA